VVSGSRKAEAPGPEQGVAHEFPDLAGPDVLLTQWPDVACIHGRNIGFYIKRCPEVIKASVHSKIM
jgi:hypothetical protein